MVWKLEFAVAEADGSIEISSEATHSSALSSVPPSSAPAIDAATPVAPPKKLCRLKSVAFAVAFQSPERTLSEDDAARLRGAIIEALASRFGAELRA